VCHSRYRKGKQLDIHPTPGLELDVSLKAVVRTCEVLMVSFCFAGGSVVF
jgi:hypothetical protein